MVSIAITFLAWGIITTLLFLSLQHNIHIHSLHFYVFGSYVDKDIKCPDMSGQYEITLINYDNTKPESVKLKDEVVNKVNSFGIEIDYVLENIGVITIKSSDEQLITKLKDEFGNQIKIEPTSAIVSNSTKLIIVEETKVDVPKKELVPATTSTLIEYDLLPHLSALEEQKIVKGIEETTVSSDIAIVNTTLQLPNETRQSQNTDRFDTILDNFSSVDQNDTINTVNYYSISTVPQISTYSPKISTSISEKIYSFMVESSIAANNKTIFFTGNHFAAISKDGANSWKYLNLTDVMPDFCCDQDVIYDSKHKLFLWYMQGNYDCSGENRSLIGISRDGSIWRFIEIKPTQIDNKLKNSWFDYPQLALSNNFLYITTNINTLNVKNIKSCSNGQTDIIWILPSQLAKQNTQTYSTIIRITLEELSKSLSNSSISPEFDAYFKNNETGISFTPVQGAKDVMYWANLDKVRNDKIRIYSWKESESSSHVRHYDRTIAAYLPMKQGLECPGDKATNLDAIKWCSHAHSRISSGWLSHGIIGLLWNAAPGEKTLHGFTTTQPYVDGAMFDVMNNMQNVGRSSIWSDTFGWLYGFTTPNENGDVGVIAVFGGGDYSLSVGVGVGDIRKFKSNPDRFWEMVPMISGMDTSKKSNKKVVWGDYLRLRSYENDSWIGTGFTLESVGIDQYIKPRIVKFDKDGITTLLNLR